MKKYRSSSYRNSYSLERRKSAKRLNFNSFSDENEEEENEYNNNFFSTMEIIQNRNNLSDEYEAFEDQIQSYKEQLIDAKLKNIKLTNEVRKLKENNNSESKLQNDNSKVSFDENIDKYQEKIKNLKERNEKLENLVIKLKETLNRLNEIYPNFLQQLSESEKNHIKLSEEIILKKNFEIKNADLKNNDDLNKKIKEFNYDIENKQKEIDENNNIIENNLIKLEEINKLKTEINELIFNNIKIER